MIDSRGNYFADRIAHPEGFVAGTGSGFGTGADGAVNLTGTGSPEGVVTASPGATYQQIDNGIFVAQWIKQSGSGNTGWV